MYQQHKRNKRNKIVVPGNLEYTHIHCIRVYATTSKHTPCSLFAFPETSNTHTSTVSVCIQRPVNTHHVSCSPKSHLCRVTTREPGEDQIFNRRTYSVYLVRSLFPKYKRPTHTSPVVLQLLLSQSMLPRCSFVQQVSQAPLHIYITLSNIYLNYLHYKTTDSLYIKYSIIVLDSNLSSESLIILNLSGRYLSFIVYLCFNSLKLSLHLASIGIVRPSLQTTPLKLHVFHAL